ncbi:MAG TPA: hypothetical protein VLW53_03925, partial [Candidatus Eisenbacteria bacterium]|nr:hypothetical protein [Candidatus Eisenbacteria bacterium]
MTRNIRSVARLAMGITAVAAFTLGAVPATAFADTTAADTTTYDAAPAGSTTDTVTGTSDGAGGCTFTLTTSLAPGSTVKRVDELSYSASTCTSKLAYTSGTYAAADTADASNVSNSGLVASTLSGTAPAVTAATTIHSAGYLNSWFRDPAYITVNSVRNSTDWHWNGSCTVSPVYGSYHYTWFAGWVKKSSNWNNYYTCYQSTSSSYVHYHDGAFCAFTDTEVYYNRNTVHGRYNGYLVGNVSWYKSGHCSGLLSFHDYLKRTLN